MNFENELHKLQREIQTHGETYMFYRDKIDEDLEPTGETEQVAEVQGLFHVTKTYLSETTTDGARVRTKGEPMLLTICNDKTKSIVSGDFVKINGKSYKVNAKNNIQEYNLVYDISLEVILDGSVSV